ncbi:MAG: NAD(P)/FAD-dependent oxidoreductase [Pseudomonadota bacterium]
MPTAPESYDCVILGAGAAGLFCASIAAAQGVRALAVDHARAPGEKIRISGGGRCNFTNLHVRPACFLSENRHFAKSALARYDQADFIALVERHGIPYHEKTLGQLFCDGSSRDIIDLLLKEMAAAGAVLKLQTAARTIERTEAGFRLALETEGRRWSVEAPALVIATGGKSIPKMGASGFGYGVAAQFGLPIVETRPALVPLTFGGETLEAMASLAGVAAHGAARAGAAMFEEALLFTHRGLSGPAILQISSYWREGETISIDLAPQGGLFETLKAAQAANGRRAVATALAEDLPKRLAQHVAERAGLGGALGGLSDKALRRFVEGLRDWRLTPTGSEGYRKAEVTLGGVSTDALSSATMEAKSVPGLYFIGEVVDVTGWLGGYNFQWAWSSAYAAGTAIAARASGAEG